MNKNWKKNAWKVATAFIVAVIILNPEMSGLALFIDAVGLEMFFMLIEMQVLVALGIFYDKIKPLFVYLKKHYKNYSPQISWRIYREEPGRLLLLVPSPVTLMYTLVLSVVIDIGSKAF